jgi:hypothetical protein
LESFQAPFDMNWVVPKAGLEPLRRSKKQYKYKGLFLGEQHPNNKNKDQTL